ncbi:MAG TPA: barstar family protein [Rhizomicrobium sp.]
MKTAVNKIALNGASWISKDDFYNALLPALGAPPFHGRNLDALEETLASDDFNEVRQPLAITIFGADQMSVDARGVVDRFSQLVTDLKADGHKITLALE